MQDRQLKCFQGDFKAEKLVLKFVIGWWCWVEVLRSVQRAGAQPARGHWSPGMDGEFLQADRAPTYLTYQPECNCCITHFILSWTSWWKTWGIQQIQWVFFINIKKKHTWTLSTIIIWKITSQDLFYLWRWTVSLVHTRAHWNAILVILK